MHISWFSRLHHSASPCFHAVDYPLSSQPILNSDLQLPRSSQPTARPHITTSRFNGAPHLHTSTNLENSNHGPYTLSPRPQPSSLHNLNSLPPLDTPTMHPCSPLFEVCEHVINAIGAEHTHTYRMENIKTPPARRPTFNNYSSRHPL